MPYQNIKKVVEPNPYWTIRFNMDDINIEHPENFFINFDDALAELEMGRIPFIVLSPPNPINDIAFLQVAKNENMLIHVQAGTVDPTKKNNITIVYKDDVSTGDVLHMFCEFFNKGELDVSGWKELQYITPVY